MKGTGAVAEETKVPIAAIEHYSYCPRQCALMYIEHIYAENVYTMRGALAHERVDTDQHTDERGVEVHRALPLISERLGLVGRADVVEIHDGVPYPVEYKSGRRHGVHADLQLCAQALCLEEMFDVAVPLGALFYCASRRRHEIEIDATLRQQVMDLLPRVRGLLAQEHTPPPVADARCRNCSIAGLCLPAVIAEERRLMGFQSALYRIDDAQG